MPAYVLLAEMIGLIPTAFLVQALDDDADGSADATAWDAVAAQVHKQIDGPLSARYTVPFSNPLPPIVTEAAPIFAAELLYKRRGFATKETNPWLQQAADLRDKLAELAAGKIPLWPVTNAKSASASIVSTPSKATGSRGKTAI